MLTLSHLSKSFGTMLAVDDVSFTVKSGEILGLIGQNGAGKTTTFRMILNFMAPDTGTILWKGRAFTAADYDQVGYLPEERGLYPKMTVEQQILYFAQLRGRSIADIKPQIDEWLVRFGVKGKRTDKIKDLSKGNQQKVQLIATLIHQPELIILDEPFSGLDPVNAELLEEGILWLKEQGSAIIFSSHDMTNVARISDRIVMLRDGQVVLAGTIDEIRNQLGRTKLFLEAPLARETLANINGVSRVTQHGQRFELTLADETVGKTIFDLATQNGYILEFSQQAPTLDEIFRMKVEEGHV
ncbi:ABC transporter ATP-binding protein [Latilactobacillus curvatus]|uniref:ABC transporter ATP-binding protein n=1 Tax=Latilactobacillus curvatus TaxID=28038 RepID=UPI00084A0341|nr:ABC transporter ATP-binding protein [Latilactobacillus curvatus]